MTSWISWLKKHFIPHPGNNHRPHILRAYNIRTIVATVLFLELIIFLIPVITKVNTGGQMAAVLPAVLANLTNEERQSQKLQTLKVSNILNLAAQMKATDMATNSYFAHTSPEGKTPWYWLDQVGYKYQYAGENLAVNFSDSRDVTSAWMESPTHKANIIKENYTEIGTGVARGLYNGQETIFVAQVYANPVPEVITPSIATPPVVISTNREKIPQIAKREEETSILGTEDVAVVVSNNNDTTSNNEINTTKEPSELQKLLASPRNTMNIVLFSILAIIILALLLNIFIKIEHYHSDLITNGMLTIAIIGAIFIGNQYEINRNMVIIQSLDYENELLH